MASKILVADDAPTMRTIFQGLLGKLGVQEVDFVGNGLEALELIKNNAYHLVIIDNLMPGMNGVDVIANSSDFILHYKTNVLLVSAAVDMDVLSQIKEMNLPVRGVIAKPVTFANFKERASPFLPKMADQQRQRSKSSVIKRDENTTVISTEALSVIATCQEAFCGISLNGSASFNSIHIVGDAFNLVEGCLKGNFVISIENLEGYDESFIGHVLVVLGMAAQRGQSTGLITGVGDIGKRIVSLGFEKVVDIYSCHRDYYEHVGFASG